jgi:hypothetical protein
MHGVMRPKGKSTSLAAKQSLIPLDSPPFVVSSSLHGWLAEDPLLELTCNNAVQLAAGKEDGQPDSGAVRSQRGSKQKLWVKDRGSNIGRIYKGRPGKKSTHTRLLCPRILRPQLGSA